MAPARQSYKEVRIHEMAGKPPDGSADWKTFASSIPLYAGIDPDLLYKGDEDPLHVTLDIFKVNVTSKNGLVYDEPFIEALLQQLPGLGAKDGHTPWADTGSFADAADWVGHVRHGDTVWAKAYFPPGKERNQMQRIMGRRGKVRTSVEVWGTPIPIVDGEGRATGTYRLSDPELEYIDFVRAGQAALGDHQSGTPIYSSETTKPGKEKHAMAEINSMADVPQHIQEQMHQHWMKDAQVQETTRRVTELETKVKTLEAERDTAADRVTEVEQERETVQTRVKELETERDILTGQIKELETAQTGLQARILDYETAKFEQEVTGIIAAFTEGWKVTSDDGKQKIAVLHNTHRKLVIAAIGSQRDVALVKATAQTVWDEDLKLQAETLRNVLAGGSAFVGGASSVNWKDQIESDVYRNQLKEKFGGV